jgi:carbon-monoxide dehydrogenase catalytic subunit
MLEEFGTIKGEMQMPKRAPQACVDLWKAAGILPRGIDREEVEAMHRVHMGVGADYSGFLL